MGKKLGGVSWSAVTLENVPLDGAALDGFVGLEECTDYDFDKTAGTKRKIKEPKKKQASDKAKSTERKGPTSNSIEGKIEPAAKKLKLSNGFVVEACNKAKPSTGNDVKSVQPSKKENKKKKAKNIKGNSADAGAAGEETSTDEKEQIDLKDMHAWSQFQIPEEILRALAEQGFYKPTKIQELCLPPAMLGRRDILGAAQTGSGKTLAFGIPILAGIMKFKEQELAGEDVYDLQYKKSSVRRITPKVELENKQSKSKKLNVRKNTPKAVASSTNDSDEESSLKGESTDEGIEVEEENSEDETVADDHHDKETTEAQDSDSDNSDNYVHLSEMFDSDDLQDSSDEENDTILEPNDDAENDESGDEEAEIDDEESEIDDEEEVDAEQVGEGMGCVRVVDDVELPARAVTRTGRPLYALIITPTRELAMQISSHLTAAAKYTGIRVAVLVGGMAQVKQERLLAGGPELVVCTPGRMWEMLQQGNAHLQQVDNIKFLAIDETDRMVERNHFDELRPLLERLNADERRRAGRQSFVMSATLTVTHDLPAHLRGKKVTKRGKIINRKVHKMTPQQKTKQLIALLGMTDPKIVDLTATNHGTAETLTECRIACALEQKDHYLYYVLRSHPGRTIVFCNSIGCVKRLAQLFTLLKCHPLPLHASMPQRQRLRNLERFRDDPRGVLVATDVAARGLDIPDVEHVIHYQVPRTAENYVHRSGRTARANKEGLTILMMEPGEAFLYTKLCRTLGKAAELPTFPVSTHALASVKRCVSLARDVERAALVGKRRAQAAGWLQKAARECDIVVDGDFVPMQRKLDETDGDEAAAAKALQLRKKELDSMLSRPLFPRGFSYKYPTLNDPGSMVAESEENALEVMKRAMQTGQVKKGRRQSKNAPLLNLERKLQGGGEVKKGRELKTAPNLNLEREGGEMKGGKIEKKRKKKYFRKSS